MSVLDRLKGQVVGRSKINPIGWAVEIESSEFDEVITELYEVDDLRKRNRELLRTVDCFKDQIEELHQQLSGQPSLLIDVVEDKGGIRCKRQVIEVRPDGHNAYLVVISAY